MARTNLPDKTKKLIGKFIQLCWFSFSVSAFTLHVLRLERMDIFNIGALFVLAFFAGMAIESLEHFWKGDK